MMPAAIQTLAACQRRRLKVASYRDGAAMPDQSSRIEAHIPALRRFACALMRRDRQRAEDLAQDCLERALSRWHLRRAEGDVRGWMYTILYNRFLSAKNCHAPRGAPDALQGVAETEMPGQDGGRIGHSSTAICSARLRHCLSGDGRW